MVDIDGKQSADGAYLDSATVRAAATDADSGIASFEYQLNDGDWIDYGGAISLTAGEWNLRFRAIDRNENAVMHSETLSVIAAEDEAGPDPGADEGTETDETESSPDDGDRAQPVVIAPSYAG